MSTKTIIKEAAIEDFLTHMFDNGVNHSRTIKTSDGDEWGFFISPDNLYTEQVLLSKPFITKRNIHKHCRKLNIDKMYVY